MKRYLLSLLVLLAIAVPVASIFVTPAQGQVLAAASCQSDRNDISSTPGTPGSASPGSGVQIGLCLVNSNGDAISDASGYTVKFTYTNTQDKTISGTASYSSSINTFLTGTLQFTGSTSGICTGNVSHEPFTATVTKGGKNYGTYSIDLCSEPPSYTSFEKATTSSSATTDGYIKGTITYVGSDGSNLPFNGSNEPGSTNAVASGVITSSNGKTYPVDLDANGNITSPTDLPVGSYTLKVGPYLTPTTGNSPSIGQVTYTKSFTVTAADTSGSPLDVGGSTSNGESSSTGSGTGNGSGGAGATTPTCEASGFSAAWVLCPIFNLVSDGSRFIFSSILEPFLVTQPISTSTSDPTYQIWSNFRIYGDIFLIIALLVVVFGESIGGGLIDAYTAKKILPRLLTAAILINLSIYIVAALVDATNILGKGISGILTAPLTNCTAGSGNCWDFSLSNTDIVSVFGVGIVGFLATSTAIAGFLGAVLFGGGIAVSAAFTAAFFIAIPMLFAVLSVFLTLIFRKGLILFLVLISPVAFSLYVLPNTERHFKRWWDLLIEALMIYPIIVLIFGVADILSITLLQANSIAPSSLTGHVSFDVGRTLALVAAFLLQFLPLFAIPFSFRFASGALGRVYGAATSAGGVAHKALTGRREQAKQDYEAQSVAARARIYHGAREFGEKHQGPLGVGRAASRWAGAKAGGYNIEAIMSAQRAQVGKQLNEQIATGRDEEIRGLSVNKKWALAQGAVGDDVGSSNGQVRRGEKGDLEFKTLGGAWVSEKDVDAGHSRWGNNQFAQQASLAYEMRKASSEEQLQNVATNYRNVATGDGGWAMSKGEAQGAWIGAAFEHQNQHLEFKYTDADTGRLKDPSGFVDEIYEKKGSYPMAQMSSNTIEKLKESYNVASGLNADGSANPRGVVNTDQQMKIQAIAQTFMHEAGRPGGQIGMAGEGEHQVPIVAPIEAEFEAPPTTPVPAARPAAAAGGTETPAQPATPAAAAAGGTETAAAAAAAAAPARRIASTPGAAHVAERVRELAMMTGVYQEEPTGLYDNRNNRHAPTENNREQT